MNYMDMMRQQDHKRLALIEEEKEYSYGDLIALSEQMSRNPAMFSSDLVSNRIHWIQKTQISEQIIEFLAANERGEIPIIVPVDGIKGSHSRRTFAEIELALLDQKLWDHNICMGVMTSGSTGEPKVLFRSYESWADYFDTQNLIFGINQDSRLFAQGSLAFTGNLNMYLAAFSAGATVIAQNEFRPREWEMLIHKCQVNAIYLIPSKLMCFPRVLAGKYSTVKTIVSGSQGMNWADAVLLKRFFPDAGIILYYGASELSYITYITEEEMTDDRGLVGMPFPGVQVEVQDQQIYVTTPCHAAGVKCPCTVSDQGYLDEAGRLHFTGRSDNVVNVHGRKVSLWHIENVLMEQPEIQSAVVLHLPSQKSYRKQQEMGLTASQCDRDFVSCSGNSEIRVAFVVLQDPMSMDSCASIDQDGDSSWLERSKAFRKRIRCDLAGYEMPGRFIVLPEMPYRENGKVDTEKLQEIWKEENRMKFETLAAQRYSCRDMDSTKSVEQEKIKQIIRAAQVSPTACNLQRYHIKVVQTEEALEQLRPLTPCHFNAPLVFVLSVILDGGEKIQDADAAYRFAMIDAGIVVAQMALQAQELGLGTTIVGMFDEAQLRQQFAIPEEQTPVLLLPTGYPGEKGSPCILHKQRKKVTETVEWL